jgi:hypothetical protein
MRSSFAKHKEMLTAVVLTAFTLFCGGANAFPIDSNNLTERGSSTYYGGIGDPVAVTARCNTGEVVITGGCYSTNSFDAVLSESGRNGNTWVCVWKFTGAATYYASVTCAHP